MPLVLLLLFGFAISTEVNDVKVVAVVERHTDDTRQLLEKFRVNSFHIQGHSAFQRGGAVAACGKGRCGLGSEI